MENMKPMGPLNMGGNVAENWRKWKQRWNLYVKASGVDKYKCQSCDVLYVVETVCHFHEHISKHMACHGYFGLYW